jgi:uncharacterized protein YgiM (DUF1202 family)
MKTKNEVLSAISMKKLVILMIMSVFMLSFAVSVSASSKIYVNTDANLRKGPGKDYGVYTSVKDGETLKYLDDTESDDRGVDWYKVSYNGKALWISSKCATKVAKPISSAKKRVVTTADCNLRKGPGMNYKVYVAVQKGSSMKYLGKTKKDSRGVKWYKISYYGKSLWVSSKASVRKNSKTSRKVYVIEEEVNLRKGPGLKYKEVTTVSEGTVLKYLDKSSKDSRGIRWYKISYNGKKLWISSKVSTLD